MQNLNGSAPPEVNGFISWLSSWLAMVAAEPVLQATSIGHYLALGRPQHQLILLNFGWTYLFLIRWTESPHNPQISNIEMIVKIT